MKIVTVVGARPQFVKAAVVSRALSGLAGVAEEIIHTGQHYDPEMSEIFFRELEIPTPVADLGIGGLSHGAMTGRMLEALEVEIRKRAPDWVMVYGDTDSTLAGALAAAKLHVPVAHVEAGLRSFNRKMPEEINRVLTDHLSSRLFAPTLAAEANLALEGIAGAGKVYRVGDVMFDAALYAANKARSLETLEENGLQPGQYALATLHRAENTDDPSRLRALLEGIGELARRIPVLMPLHPRTRVALKRHSLIVSQGVKLIEPLGYFDMICTVKNAKLLLTDSGGVQKEAFFFQVPCLTYRDETEWVELVDLGWNKLVRPEQLLEPDRLLEWVSLPAAARGTGSPYGDGSAGNAIARLLTGVSAETN